MPGRIPGLKSDDLTGFEWMDKAPDDATRTFASLIIRGTLETLEEIDNQIRTHLKRWSFERLNKVDLAILRNQRLRLTPPEGYSFFGYHRRSGGDRQAIRITGVPIDS